jgi:hypothetical protein
MAWMLKIGAQNFIIVYDWRLSREVSNDEILFASENSKVSPIYNQISSPTQRSVASTELMGRYQLEVGLRIRAEHLT